MSALPHPPKDQRRAPRLRPITILPVRIGRGDGILVDLSTGGARVRHSAPALLWCSLRLLIVADETPITLDAEVLSSRVSCLGTGHSPTHYETRLRFRRIQKAQAAALAALVATLDTRRLRRLVDNMHGWFDEPQRSHERARPPCFLRVTRDGSSWIRRRTSRPGQPDDGFVLPGDTDPIEIDLLCKTYERLDDDGRQLIRSMAAAAIDEGVFG